MLNRRTNWFQDFLSIGVVVLALAVVQSPLWRPMAAPRSVTATIGASVVVPYRGEITKATIFRTQTATISADGPGRIMIHGHRPGTTNLLIRYKDGGSQIYEVVVLPG